MGFSQKGRADKSVPVEWHDRRLRPHPLLVATRVGRGNGHWGAKGLRLRFSVSTAAVRAAVDLALQLTADDRRRSTTFPLDVRLGVPRRASVYPDFDESGGEQVPPPADQGT
jgi:hypothetical protein